jgi:hypothetical protein
VVGISVLVAGLVTTEVESLVTAKMVGLKVVDPDVPGLDVEAAVEPVEVGVLAAVDNDDAEVLVD